VEYLYRQNRGDVVYKAEHIPLDHLPGGKWRPSIHMPRWASRITLEITNVGVERVQEITKEDVEKEGGWEWEKHHCDKMNPPETHRETFQLMWDSINGKDSWISNPWVWVIEFKQIS
jgi:hypothetical protein